MDVYLCSPFFFFLSDLWEGYKGSFMATEELLKLIQEDPMWYEGYLAYAKYLETINLKQAYLTYNKN